MTRTTKAQTRNRVKADAGRSTGTGSQPAAVATTANTNQWSIGPNAPLRLLSASELCPILGVSRATLHRATRSQGFPRPVQIMGSTRAARYDSRAVWAWLEARLQDGKAA